MHRIGTIFDWDGVVINSANLHEESWEILAKNSNSIYPMTRRGFGKRNETIIGKILRWSEDQGEIIKWGSRKEEIYRELGIEKGIPLIPETKTFIRNLHEQSIPMSIGTSTERKNIDLAIQQNQLSGLFAGAICSEDVSKGNPIPVFLKAADLIGMAPSKIVSFLKIALMALKLRQAEMISVGITTTKPERELLNSGAIW